MNFLEIANKIMNGEKIFNLPLRVSYYARVSTDSELQLNSLSNQLNYYENYIKSKSNWTYIDGYVDSGKSGVRVEKRTAFKKMINDAKMGKFDLIITKEVSRFARDLEDSIHYIRELKNSNVGVFFENQNLNTFDSNSELILNIMFNLAQDESRKLSSRIKFGHNEAINKGHVLGSSNITGYKKDNCKLVINEKEAKFIKLLFELYSTGKYGFYKLSKTLGELGYFNKKGNFYDKDSLKRMIQNPKYKGFYRGKTYEVIDYRTKKRRKIDVENQIIYKSCEDIIPAIISEDLWDRANNILLSRTKNCLTNNFFSGGLKYSLSSKLFCNEHKVSFQRSNSNKKRPTWSCGMYLQYRLDACKSPIIAEKDLLYILNNIFSKIISKKEKIINTMLELYKSIDISVEYEKELVKIDDDIALIENKKNKTLDLVLNGILSENELQKQFAYYKDEINYLLERKDSISAEKKLIKEGIIDDYSISNAIKEEINGGSLEFFIRKFVSKIIVSKINDDRHNIYLEIYLNISNDDLVNIGEFSNKTLVIKNQKCNTLENLRKDRKGNSFTYSVYIL